MSVTPTIYAWWLWPYLATGVVLYLPLNYIAHRRTVRGESFVNSLIYRRFAWTRARRYKRIAWDFLLQVTCWPLAAWEATR